MISDATINIEPAVIELDLGHPRQNVRFGSKADMCECKKPCPLYPESGHVRCKNKCPLCAKSGHRSVLLLIWLLAFGAKAVDQLRRADGMCSVSFPPFNQSNT